MVRSRKKPFLKQLQKELSDPIIFTFGITGIVIAIVGTYLMFSGSLYNGIMGLGFWSFGLVALGFTLGHNYGKYGG